ncbi:MAG: KtrAB potassium uptake system, integral membrane component KtrB [uncultured Corynebacteriales bacterium]|uniref:KtrAB potassium uptake system, integral membrane component KtrB n=1 Tax=uncultured Mycobacteriales bacterium TaxID=581187 RepID=A0A6J4JUI3_9ACTN|nr:MAG: KtrAB potassium uptake system, integral membrane component KtrB [uncultured Corynebacteriales bacterium]
MNGLRRPGVVVLVGFASAIGVLTLLLMLPVAHQPGERSSVVEALFTATSAVCITGLSVVDTPNHWSTTGQVLIMVGVQFGGLGFMTSASLLGLTALRRLGLRTRILAAAETRTVGLGDVRRVIRGVALVSLVTEALLAVVLGLRLWARYDVPPGRAAYEGLFHAVMAFNNSGFALYSDSLIRFATDPWICLPIAVAVILGALGFPVLFELRRELRTPRTWTLHTKITVSAYVLLTVAGTVAVTALEWSNRATLGPLGVGDKLLVGFFMGGPQARSAGFNSLDVGAMNDTSWLVLDCLMFVGGGSGGMGGGIKVTTFMVLFFAIVAEVRGDPAVTAFGKEISTAVLRQALSVALLGVALVALGTLMILGLSDVALDRALFEVVSAFATNGLSTGITGSLPEPAQYVLVVLMFTGRLGPVTVASALALRERQKLFRLPEERPIVG